MALSSKIKTAPMLANIGVGNVPMEGWPCIEGFFPSIVVSLVDRLTATPKAPQGFFFKYYNAGPVVPMIVLWNDTRDIVIHSLKWRQAALSAYTSYIAFIRNDVAQLHQIIPPTAPGFLRRYPLYTGGAPPTTNIGTSYAATRPDTWAPSLPAVISWSELEYGFEPLGAWNALDWLVPATWVICLYATSGYSILAGLEWHEQPPGAHSGNMIAFP